MSLLRSDKQVALNDLLELTWKTADHYRDSAEFLRPSPACAILREIADAREALSDKVREAVEANDDLPSPPDQDRETLEQLLHRAHASLSQDELRDVLQQHLDAEREFEAVFTELKEAGAMEEEADLVKETQQHLQWTQHKLRNALEDSPARN